MSKELIVSLNGREKKIAIIEDDVVTEFYVERGDENQGIVGNIYKGKVMKVLPGMQSAFVDIGLERDAFLYVSDFLDDEEFEGAFQEDKREERKPQRQERTDKFRPARNAAPEIAPVIEAAEVEENDEATLEALSHIEELIAEPVIEHEPEEDLVEARKAGTVPSEESDFLRRRQRRLHYAEPEVELVADASAPVMEEEIADAEVVEDVAEAIAEAEPVEAQEEATGRRRRRPRPKRGARAEADDAPAVVEEAEPVKPEAVKPEKPLSKAAAQRARAAEAEAEEAPKVSHLALALAAIGEPMERINDDDLAQSAPSKVVEPEEIITKKLEVEPTPEIHVGSLQADATSAGDFERISDDEETAAAPAASSASQEEVVATENTAGIVEIGAEASEELLADAQAEIREKQSRAEFATRRGGRGRRRRTPNDGPASGEETDAPAPANGNVTANVNVNVKPSSFKEKDKEKEEADVAPINGNEGLFSSRGSLGPRAARPVISDLLREGQEVIVQIAKEPIGQKGARITSHVVLPGRYVVYMPTVDHIGVSRKIGTDEERQRLKRTLNQLRAESNIPGGFIVRTAAGGRTTEELREDVQYLGRTWGDMRRRSDRSKAPAVVHRDLDLVQRILRDQLSSDFTAIRVDNEFEYERILDFVNRFAPKLINRVKLYTKETPILEEYGVQAEVDKAVKPRVWLRSGGYIVINQTEALVAIDVNTGKFVGRSNRLEDTIVKTNLEAAKEIARQIRLRDLGGIIILDFIDMEERRNRQRVMQTLEQELRYDKSPSKILQFNDFGLVAITRKRVKQSLERTLCAPCSYCGGGGMVKSAQTVCYDLLAETRRVAKHQDHPNEVVLRVNPEVAKALRTTERDIFTDIESHFTGVVTIKSDPTVHQEQFDIALI